MEPEERFRQIEALLHAMAERENQMEIRFNQRMDRMDRKHEQAMQRMDRMDQRTERNHQQAMERMDKFDRKLEAMRKLMQFGMKLMVQLQQDQRELKKTLSDSLRRSGNGHRRSA